MKEKKRKHFNIVMTVFIVGVLILTFLSKTIYNYNLPTVTAAFASAGNIKMQVSGKTEVTYKNTINIYGKGDGRVSKIYASVGDEVKKDQILIDITPDDGNKKAEIKAPKDGVILASQMEEGMYTSVSLNTVLFQLAEKQDELEADLKITSDEAEKVSKESNVTIKIKGLSGEIEGTIYEINSYMEDNGEEGYKVKISFNGEGKEVVGKIADVTIGNVSENYETILPSYALRKDNTGYYVFTLQEQSSILGKNYVATRTSVDLLDSDEEGVAVMGINTETPVIVSSSSDQEIEDGDRVMYRESGE